MDGVWTTSKPGQKGFRPYTIGRKNWMFSKCQAGATASANLGSFVETAKADNANAYEYLRLVFTCLPTVKSMEAIEQLLPWNTGLAKMVAFALTVLTPSSEKAQLRNCARNKELPNSAERQAAAQSL